MENLKIKNLYQAYNGKNILDGISLELKSGEIVGIIGENGEGKSTLLKCILGIITQFKGTIEYSGISVSDRKRYMQKINGMIESPVLYEEYTGNENLQYEMLGRGIKEKDWCTRLVHLFGMESYLDTKVKKYSSGMKQKLAIVKAMINRPKILILDEPTNALDLDGKQCLLKAVKILNKEAGTSVIISSHSIGEMEKWIEKFYFLGYGKLTEIVRDGCYKVIECRKDIYMREKEHLKNIDITEMYSEGVNIILKIRENMTDEFKDKMKNDNAVIMEKNYSVEDEYKRLLYGEKI